jgi:hypothetical protein
MTEPEMVAVEALETGLGDLTASGYDDWTAAAMDRVDELAAVLLLRRSGHRQWFSWTSICSRRQTGWESLEEVGNGDHWIVDPRVRHKGRGFVWNTGTFGGRYEDRWILSTAGALGDEVKSLSLRVARHERTLRVQPVSGAFVALVACDGARVPGYRLLAISEDGGEEAITYEPPVE